MISLRLLVSVSIFSALNLICLNTTFAKPGDAGTQSLAKLQKLNSAVVKEPRRADAYLNRGVFYSAADDDDKALSDFNEAIQLEPNNSRTYLCRAELFFKMELFAKAAQDYISSATLNKFPFEKANAYCQAGRARVKGGQSLEGSKLLDQALALAAPAQKPTIFLNRGISHSNLKQYEAAVADINSMGNVADHWETARSCRATALMALGRYEAAVPDLTEAIKQAATKPSSLEGVVFQSKVATYLKERAMCFDKLGRKDLAISDQRKADAAQEDSLLFAPFR